MAYYHAVLGSPTMSTMQAAVRNGLLASFPGLTLDKLLKNKVHTMATAKGHLDRTRKGQNSTHRTESIKQREARETRERLQSAEDNFPTKIEAPTEALRVRVSSFGWAASYTAKLVRNPSAYSPCSDDRIRQVQFNVN